MRVHVPGFVTPSPPVRFITALGISSQGDWLSTIAVAVGLYALTGSVTAPATAFLVRVLPRPVSAYLAGPLISRIGPLRSAVLLAAAQGAATAALAGALALRMVLVSLALLAIAQGLAAAARPCVQAALPQLVEPAGLRRCGAAVQLTYALAAIVGPVVATVMLPLTSPALLVALDACTFAIAAGLVASIAGPASPSTRPALPARSDAGFRAVLHEPILRQLTLAQAGNAAVITAVQSVIVVIAAEYLGSATRVGLLYGAVALGSGLTGIVLLLTHRGPRRRLALAVATLGELIPITLIALTPIGVLIPGLLFIAAASATVYQVALAAELPGRVPAEMLGVSSAAVSTLTQVGMIAGAVIALVGAHGTQWRAPVLVVAAGGLLITALGLAGPGRKHHRDLRPQHDGRIAA